MSTKRNRSRRSGTNATGDDFSVIVGMPKSIGARLQKAGILTYAQLAALSESELLEAAGDSDDVNAERVRREDWTGQVRRLAGLKTRAQFLLQLALNEDRTVSSMKVTHSESGEEAEWIGWREDQLIDFLRQQGQFIDSLPSEDPSNGSDAEPATNVVRLEEQPVPVAARLNDVDTVGAGVEAGASKPLEGAEGSATDGVSPAAVTDTREPEPRLRELRVASPDRGIGLGMVPERPFSVLLAFDLGQAERAGLPRRNYTTMIYAKVLGRSERRLIGQSQGSVGADETVRLEVPAGGLSRGVYRMEAEVVVAQPGRAPAITEKRHLLKGSLVQVA